MSALEEAIKTLNKQFGSDYLTEGLKVKNVVKHPVGIDAIDLALGGGIPEAKIVMFAGKFSAGKSTTAVCAAAQCQKENGKVVYIDTEGAFDATWALKFGFDISKAVYCTPENVEQVTDIVETLLMSGEVDMVIWDSTAVTPSAKELDDSAEQKSMGGTAKAIGLFMRKITTRLHSPKFNLKTRVILINQLRDNVSGYGSALYTPGGKQLHYQSDAIIWLTPRSEPVGGKEAPQGITVDFKVIKSRWCPPLRNGSYDLMFRGGINNKKSVIEYAIKFGLIRKAGAMYTFGENKVRGIDALVNAITDNQLEKIKPVIMEEMAKGNYDLKEEDDLTMAVE